MGREQHFCQTTNPRLIYDSSCSTGGCNEANGKSLLFTLPPLVGLCVKNPGVFDSAAHAIQIGSSCALDSFHADAEQLASGAGNGRARKETRHFWRSCLSRRAAHCFIQLSHSVLQRFLKCKVLRQGARVHPGFLEIGLPGKCGWGVGRCVCERGCAGRIVSWCHGTFPVKGKGLTQKDPP